MEHFVTSDICLVIGINFISGTTSPIDTTSPIYTVNVLLFNVTLLYLLFVVYIMEIKKHYITQIILHSVKLICTEGTKI